MIEGIFNHNSALVTGISSLQIIIYIELLNWVTKLHIIIISVVYVQPSFFNVPSGHDGSSHGPNVSIDSIY